MLLTTRLSSHCIQMNHPTWMWHFHYPDCFSFWLDRLYYVLKNKMLNRCNRRITIKTMYILSYTTEDHKFSKSIYIRATDISVTPHPMLQHQPTRHNKTEINWHRPTTKLRKNEQNLRSQLSPWKSGECRVIPQQQNAHMKPLRMVPRSRLR